MIVVLRQDATKEQIGHILEKVQKLGLTPHISEGKERTIIGVIGPEDILRVTPLEVFPGVDKVMPVLAPYKLVSREIRHKDSIIKITPKVRIGGKKIAVIAGPCSIESYEILFETAKRAKKAGATILRGGAFKPRR